MILFNTLFLSLNYLFAQKWFCGGLLGIWDWGLGD